MAKKITVLLVDDHQLVRQGVRAFMDALPDFDVVGEAESVRRPFACQPNTCPTSS